jgi:homoserine O-acetyltransferase
VKFAAILWGDVMLASVMTRGADLGTVGDRSFPISGFRLQNGTVMPQVKIAYETYGRLAANGRNAVLIAHGYTSSHHAAGRNPANGNQPGWWDGLQRDRGFESRCHCC